MLGFFLVAVAVLSMFGLALTGEPAMEAVVYNHPRWQPVRKSARQRKLDRRKKRQRKADGCKNRR